MDDYFDIGNFHRKISTNNKEAQLWFDRGLTWCYGFNHKEGLTCFEKATELDPDCAMLYWGITYSLGPNYNKAWGLFDPKDLAACVKKSYHAIEKAQSLAGSATPVEQALIKALHARVPQDTPADDLMEWSRGYADAMGPVYEQFPDDLDVLTLYGDSLICLTPWALWNIKTGKPAAGSRVVEAKAVFDHALSLEGAYSHPGLLHMYIHLIEMSATPEKGLVIADRLRGLCPDVGHFEHMPTHLDVLAGDYRRSISSNTSAAKADKKISDRDGYGTFYGLYRAHTYHSLIYAAMLAGKSELAIEKCLVMESTLPEWALRIESPPMANWLEGFNAVRMHVLVRFGRWDDILKLPLPKDQTLYCATTAMTHYARTIALAATGRVEEAEKERVVFKAAFDKVPTARLAFPNKYVDVLAVAEKMIDGELEYRKKNYDEAWKHLRMAVELDDSLVYAEPWGWMMPTRHAFGALLLEQGHVEEAAGMYAADLGFDNSLPPGHRHPNNVFALHGYHECLVKLGRKAEARLLEQELRLGMAVADVDIKSSCFCRLSTETATNGSNGACH